MIERLLFLREHFAVHRVYQYHPFFTLKESSSARAIFCNWVFAFRMEGQGVHRFLLLGTFSFLGLGNLWTLILGVFCPNSKPDTPNFLSYQIWKYLEITKTWKKSYLLLRRAFVKPQFYLLVNTRLLAFSSWKKAWALCNFIDDSRNEDSSLPR